MNKARKFKAFTLVELLIVIAILAILSVVVFVVINPQQRINDANDATRRANVESIISAISLYVVDNVGDLPQYDDDSPTDATADADLPTVTTADVTTNGVDCNLMYGLEPGYLSTIPDASPTASDEYRCGQTSAGAAVVGVELSDTTTFVKTL